MNNKESIMLEAARKLEDQIVAWRREFHMHPELGFHEERTSAKVTAVLEDLGYRVRTGVGRTGVVAELGEGHPVIGIRADMDALPIQEANDVSYASQVPGVMHACGHDAHTAIALGVATLLVQETFPGTIRFLFQPAEEIDDEEGFSGAPRMVEDGALEGMDRLLALHVDSTLKTGDIELGDGPSSAGDDSLTATIIGRGGHGAMPHEVVDPIFITSHVILALHGIVSRRLRPFEPAVVSIGSIHGGEAENVIPDRVTITGTIRYMNSVVQEQIHNEIKRALEVARTLGGDYEHEIEIGNPPMINDSGVVDRIRQVAIDLLGEERIQPPMPEMGAEDYGIFTSRVPGAMFGLGCLIEDDERVHHNARFDIDESCLPIGVAILTETALRFLRSTPT
jgi:amidohydrolase